MNKQLGFVVALVAALLLQPASSSLAGNETGPVLTVTGSHISPIVTSSRDTPVVSTEVPPFTTVVFCWSAQPGSTGDALATHRWGWNILDPDDPEDAGWETLTPEPFTGGETCVSRGFTRGTPTFVVQVTDVGGATSRAIVRILITPDVASEVMSWGAVKAAH